MRSQDDPELPSQFYSGLVADLYDSLVGEPPEADQYAQFLDLFGTPALELACGSGAPLIDLLARGYDVEGLDSSSDMLNRCRSLAEGRGLPPRLHHCLMQSFTLRKRFRSIFLAGPSFTLLTNESDAAATLGCIYDHLEVGGHALVPIEQLDPDEMRRSLGVYREAKDTSGSLLRVALVSIDFSEDGRSASLRLRYERISASGVVEVVERNWRRRWWTQAQFEELARAAQFAELAFLDQTGAAASPAAPIFVALARKS